MPKKKKGTKSNITWVYARYSDRGQNEASIEQQIQKCREFAERNGLQVVEIVSDKAISGKTDKRPGFQRMMRAAERQEFDVLIAWKSNRMGRNMQQALSNMDKLMKLDIRVMYTEEDYQDNAAGRFALRSMMNVNQFYSEGMAEDVRRGMMHNAERAMVANGSLPFGYKISKNKKYELDVPKNLIVKEIFLRVARGESFADIARDLNARGLKTKTGSDWSRSSFRLLANERYTGVYIYDDIRIEGGIPQIVDKELFLDVQEKIGVQRTKKRHRANGDYALTGKIYCGDCGDLMVGYGGTSSTGKQHFYYNCRQRIKKQCNKDYVRREWIEKEVSTAIQNMIMSDDIIEKITDSVFDYVKHYKERSEITILEEQYAENKKMLNNITNAITQGILTETTKSKLLELEAEQKRIQNLLLLENAHMLNAKREDTILWFSLFRRGNVDDKEYQAKLIDNLIIATYVYEDHFKLEFNYNEKPNRVKIPYEYINKLNYTNAQSQATATQKGAVVRTAPLWHARRDSNP